MQRCYLVCYDISNSKRLQRIHKLMKGYGESWQYSVFFCMLKGIDRVRMQADIEKEINMDEDQVVIIDLGSNEKSSRQAVTVIGQRLPEEKTGIEVV